MSILVAGATGSVGGKIVRALLERGEAVRALVRPQTDAAALERAGATIVRGDLTRPATLAPACDGVSAVVSTASATGRSDDTPHNVDALGTGNLIDAAVAAGARRFVFVSTIAASPDSPVPAFRAKAEAEAHLRASGLDYTIVQANAFMDIWFGMLIEMPLAMGRPVTLVGESLRRHSFVAERDVVAFMVAGVYAPHGRSETIVVGGPEAVTLRDVVHAYEQASGRVIPVRSVAPGQPIPGLPEPVWGMAAALESFDSPIPMEETARAWGVTPTSVREHARVSRLAALSA